MNKPKFSITILIIFISTTIFGQTVLSTTNKKAKKIYLTAIAQKPFTSKQDFCKQMNRAMKTDSRFVESYWQLADNCATEPEEAIAILTQAVEKCDSKKDDTLLRLIKILKSSGKYKEALDIANRLSTGCPQRAFAIEECKELLDMTNNPVPFSPQNLKYANSNKSEYFPSVTADDNILSVTYSEQSMAVADEDLYQSTKINNQWMPFMPIKEINSYQFNEGSQTISADGRYMFFVGCNRPDGLGSCDIYYSINIGGKWSKPINAGQTLNTDEWESNPALSPTGDELFFTSNRQPSFGKRDLWHCKIKISDNGTIIFGEPQNMGKPINSAEDDFSPYIHADNKTLYFLSTGHTNFGGSDIFISRKTDGKWGKPKNLGYPINTKDYCYGFTITGKGDKGYISLNNKEIPKRQFDIYEFELYPAIRPQSMGYVKGIVCDAESKKPLGSTIKTFDYNAQKTLSETLSDPQTGVFTTFIPDTGEYGINIRKKGYIFHSSKLINRKDTVKIFLQPIKKGNSIILKNIFFDLNSYNLKEQSHIEIRQLTTFLAQNPTISIEIIGHTDNQGSIESNITLSQNRAKAVKKALIEQGIAPSRVSDKGMGQRQPIATNETESGRQQNRRVEFVIK